MLYRIKLPFRSNDSWRYHAVRASFTRLVLICLYIFAAAPITQAQVSDWNGFWTGSYNYTYTDTCTETAAGNVEMMLYVSNNVVSGSGTISGLVCWYTPSCEIAGYGNGSGGVSGTVSNNSISVGFAGTTMSGPCDGFTFNFAITGALSGNTITGTLGSFGPSTLTLTRQPYKTLGPASAACPQCGDPISLGIGNLFEQATDYTSAGINPLSFTRYYNSLGDSNTYAFALGKYWRSNFDRYLNINQMNGQPILIIVERGDGKELNFTPNGTAWSGDSDVPIGLVQLTSTWVLTNNDDTVETYSSVNSGVPLLTSIQARDGYTQIMQYNASDQLVSVTDSFGRALQFSYQSNLLHTVTAPSGLVLTYGYDSSGVNPGVLDRLASVTYSTTPQTSQFYLYENSSFPFALTGIIDENGNRFATWTYDSTGRATSSEHAGGADFTAVIYNDTNGTRTVTNALGLAAVYDFAALQGVPKLTGVNRLATTTTAAAVMSQTYDTNGYIASVTDWNTNKTSFTNDNQGQPLIVSEAVGTTVARSTTNTYLTNFHLPMQIVAPRVTAVFTYDGLGNMLTRTETDKNTGTVPYSTSGQTRAWTNTYDSLGHVLTATGPRTDVTATVSYAYDSSNNLSTVTDPLAHVTHITKYNGSGLPLSMTDPNGVTTTFTYDTRDRLLTRTVLAASGNATNTFQYDAVGQLTSLTLPDGSLLIYQYDAAHRLQSVSNSLGESITYTLDALGNITQQNTENAGAAIVKTQSHVFDQLGRMLQQIGAYSETTTYGYDNDSNRLSTEDGLNNTTTRGFDALNRLIRVTDPLIHTNKDVYDTQDNLTSVTDPRALVTSYVYDGFRRVIQVASPDTGTTVYHLDFAGNRISETDARGIVTQRIFDKLNRVISEIYTASPSENITYTYDSTAGGNLGVGRLTGYTDESGSTTLFYNERGDVTNTTRIIGGTAYTYNLADHVTSITYPSGDVVTYGRDSQGRISSATYHPFGGGTPTALASNVTYAPFGPLTGFFYGNALTRTQTYDEDYRLTGITTLGALASIQYLGIGYDAVSDITAVNDDISSTRDQTFGYDPDYRLTQAIGDYGTLSYTYDADGNRLTHIVNSITETDTYSSTANWLLTTVITNDTRHLAYTANGNIKTDDRGTKTNLVFTYSNRNRFHSLTNGTTIATYSYNALGERVITTVGSVTTDYHYDEQRHLIAETQPGGAVIREHIWLDDMPLAEIESNGAIHYIHTDYRNTPQKITDASQNLVADYQQGPFGEPVLIGTSLATPTFRAELAATNTQFQLAVLGLSNYTYIVQATTNLVSASWVSIATNVAPFTFTDSQASNYLARFYRLYYAESTTLSLIPSTLSFPGQYYDAESGLDYNMMRDYDPTLGRYIESDPIGLAGGDVSTYVYAGENPINGIDPLALRVLVGYHSAVFPGDPAKHLVIVLEPDNPSDFSNYNIFSATGGAMATIGAQIGGPLSPSGWDPLGSLQGQFNYPGDNPCKLEGLTTVNPPSGMTDRQFINALISAALSYNDNQSYFGFLGLGYNSNSYVSGILTATGATLPIFPVWLPGYNTPIPLPQQINNGF
jgi:RHS repeat-associated protein